MEDDVEVVEELSQPPPAMLKPTPTRPGDITSTTDPVPMAAGESNIYISHIPDPGSF